MDDIAAIGAVILMVLGWYGLVRLAGHPVPSPWRESAVWCARMKCVSLIETAPPAGNEKRDLAVCRCLLWPEIHDCDQRCIR